jgi:hypothetical protein
MYVYQSVKVKLEEGDKTSVETRREVGEEHFLSPI